MALLPNDRKTRARMPKRSDDYRDPPRVVARRERILARWKAEGRVINQPRLALSLAIARQAEKYLGDTKWGRRTNGIRAARLRRDGNAHWGKIANKKAQAAKALKRKYAQPRAELAEAQQVNPYALPEKPVARSGHTL